MLLLYKMLACMRLYRLDYLCQELKNEILFPRFSFSFLFLV